MGILFKLISRENKFRIMTRWNKSAKISTKIRRFSTDLNHRSMVYVEEAEDTKVMFLDIMNRAKYPIVI